MVDADIKGCFDNIDHSYLMDQVSLFPAKETIHRWLKAGYVEFSTSPTNITPTDQGTPQGGVISPLLANIALHGLEAALGIKTRRAAGHVVGKRTLIRYADDFVILCQSKDDALKALEETQQWLQKKGIRISQRKNSHYTCRRKISFPWLSNWEI